MDCSSAAHFNFKPVLCSALFLFHRHQNKTGESGERERAKKEMCGEIALAKEFLAKEILQYPIHEGEATRAVLVKGKKRGSKER